MLPPPERLDPSECPRREGYLRLVDEGDLLVGDGAPKVACQHDVVEGVAVLVWVVDRQGRPPAFRVVERDIRAAQQVADVDGAILRRGDTHTGAEAEREVAHGEASGKLLADAGRAPFGAVEVVGEDRKLITAEAGGVAQLAHGVDEVPGDLPQDRVARLVPERVVHLFEAVQVDDYEGCGRTRFDALLQPSKQPAAVRQTRQLGGRDAGASRRCVAPRRSNRRLRASFGVVPWMNRCGAARPTPGRSCRRSRPPGWVRLSA